MRSSRRCLGASAGLLLGLLLLLAPPAGAVPANPEARVELSQPSGTSFRAQLYGDEWQNGYEVRGYTIVRDARSGVWEFAKRGERGSLRPSGRRATADPPAVVRRHLRDRADARRARRLRQTGFAAGRVARLGAAGATAGAAARRSPTLNDGEQPSLVILAEFKDRSNLGTTPADWSARFFGPTGSVHEYYDEVSYGNLAMTPAAETSAEGDGLVDDGVVGWLSLNRVHPGSDLDDAAEARRDRLTAAAAIRAAEPAIDYSAYDSNEDGAISADELHVIVIAAGGESSDGCDQPSVWGHNWSTFNAETPSVDGVAVGGYRQGGSYSMFGERHCNAAGRTRHQATLGVMVHELGHDLDLPDLYDIDGSSDEAGGDWGGVGDWSVMASGSWLPADGPGAAGSQPPHPDAFSKYYEGWTNPTEVTADGTYALDQAATSAEALRLLENPSDVDWAFGTQPGSGEYFLVENRQRMGYDAALPGCGLAIWHVDETRTAANNANANDARRLVELEQADRATNPRPWNAADLWISGSFDGTSTPNSDLYGGATTGVAVSNFSPTCAATMSADFTVPGGGVGGSPGNDAFASARLLAGSSASRSGDTNVGASKETGEPAHAGNLGGASVWYRWTAPDTGPVTVTTEGSDFNTTLAAYTGGSVGALNGPVASNDDIGSGVLQSEVSFDAIEGTTYRIAVDGFDGGLGGGPATGQIELALDQSIPPDDTAPRTTITSGPRTYIRTTRRRVPVRFAFRSNEPGSSFACRITTAAQHDCSSGSASYGIPAAVKARRWTFTVRATDQAGNTDPTAARRVVTVKRVRRR